MFQSKIVFWIIAAIAVFWHAMGCVNLMQQLSPTGLAGLPAEYQDFIAIRPIWATVGFAVSVIAGLIGAILLILRHSLSARAFMLSALGAFVTLIPSLSLGGTSIIVGTAMSIALAAFLAWYAGRVTR